MIKFHNRSFFQLSLGVRSLIFGKCIHHERQGATIDAGRRFDDKRRPAFVLFLIKPRQIFTGCGAMRFEIEVGA